MAKWNNKGFGEAAGSPLEPASSTKPLNLSRSEVDEDALNNGVN